MMKRSYSAIARLLFAAFLAAAPAACGEDGPGTEGKGGTGAPVVEPARGPGPEARQITLNWIGHWKGEGKREDLVHEIRREYEFLNPDVTVNLVFDKDMEGEEADYKERTAAAVVEMIRTGKVTWDVIFLDVAIYEYVSDKLGDPDWVAKHVVDFAEVPGFIETQKDFIVNDPRFREKVGGILTGPFIESYIMSLWYNTDVAAKAGIEVKERGMTYEDFVGYAEELHAYNRTAGSPVHFIKLCSWNRLDMLFEFLFKSQFDDFPAAVEKRFTGEKKEAFLRTLEAFERIGGYQPAVNAGWEDLTTTEFLRDLLFEDDALFVMGGSFMYNQFRGVDAGRSVKMRPAENPVMGKANGLVGDYVPAFAVMKQSPNRDAAVDLVMSWTRPKVAEKWVRYTKTLTGTKGELSRVAVVQEATSENVYERFVLDMEREYEGVPIMYIRTPTYIFGAESPVSVLELREKLAEILEGRTTAREYFDEVMGRIGS